MAVAALSDHLDLESLDDLDLSDASELEGTQTAPVTAEPQAQTDRRLTQLPGRLLQSSPAS